MTQEFQSVLMQLADESRPVRSIQLFPLSDIGRERLPYFARAWNGLASERRVELIAELVEQAEKNIHLNFHAILRSLMHDPNAGVRKLAIEGLWEDEKTSLIPPLIRRLRDDESVGVRAAAAVSLGRFVGLGAVEEIPAEAALAAESALHETWFREGEVNEVRRRALEGFAFGSMPDLNELILNAYYDEDAPMRQSSVFAMGRTADGRWSKLVLSEMESYEPAMRFEAAQAAGEMGLRSAVRPLIRRLDDPDETVRDAAVAALGKIGGPLAKRALRALLQSDDEALVQAAEDALDELTFGAVGTEKALDLLGEELDEPRRGGLDLDDEDDEEDDGFGDVSDFDDEESGWDDEDGLGIDGVGLDDDELEWDEDGELDDDEDSDNDEEADGAF